MSRGGDKGEDIDFKAHLASIAILAGVWEKLDFKVNLASRARSS